MKINNPDKLPYGIINAAIGMVEGENPGRTLTAITVRATEEPGEYGITPTFSQVPFERIRRITGYLSKVDRWNPAKKAELGDRLIHTSQSDT